MTREQAATWAAVQAQLRRGGAVAAGVERCIQAQIPVRVERLHLGSIADPDFGRRADVSAEYGLTTPGAVRGKETT